MLDRFYRRLGEWSRPVLAAWIVACSVLGSMAVVGLFSWLFHGELLGTFFVTGLAASLCVSSVVTAVMTQLLQRLKLAEGQAKLASDAKGQFLANLSHEIRTPLNVITGMTYLIRQSGLTTAQARRFQQLERAADHLIEVVNSVLDMSKIEAGKLVLEQAPIELGSVLDAVSAMVAGRAEAKDLRWRVDNRVPAVRLRGDATRLRQALLNYASNAVKFTEVGEITLTASVDADEGSHLTLRFAVEDTGCGVDPVTLSRLFTAYEQASESTARTHGGTGLGLSITRRLAELMGGQAGATSQAGLGSTFWFTARLARAQAHSGSQPKASMTARDDDAGSPVSGQDRPAAQRALAGPRGPVRRALVVDDDEVSLEISAIILREAGLQVSTCSSGVEALKLSEATRFDFVLLDRQMPKLDGLEAARRLRAQPGWHDVPIVAFTANVMPEDCQACADAGMDDIVPKPAKRRDLLDVLERWLGPPEESFERANPRDAMHLSRALHPPRAPAPPPLGPSRVALDAVKSRVDGLPTPS